MNENYDGEVFEIDLKSLLEVLVSRIRLICLIVFLFGVSAFLLSKLVITPQYTTGVTMYVNNNKDGVSGNLNINDITASEKLVTAYANIIRSNAVLNVVAEETELGYTSDQLRAMISTPVDETQILTIVVKNQFPEHAQIIANAVADIAPGKITEVVEGSSMKVIDYATCPLAPSSPNVLMNTFIGLFLGVIVSIGIILIMEMLDTRIKSEKEIESLIGIPVIGVIPEILLEEDNN